MPRQTRNRRADRHAPAGIVRRKKTPALAVRLGLLGVVGLIAFGVVGAITFAVNLSMRHPITNSLGMTLLYCPPGTFTMGSPADEKGRSEDENEVSVTISKGFYLGKTAVTQAEFKSVMGSTPWSREDYIKEGDDYPATYVSWNDAAEFCRKLTARESQAGALPQGYVYALPTECSGSMLAGRGRPASIASAATRAV